MIFDTPHSGITFGKGRLSIPAGGLVELFGTAAAGLLAGTSPALEIRDTQPVANDPTRLTLLGKTAIAGLQLGPDTIVTASFEAVAAGGAELHATLRIECPERWRIDDSFPGRPWSGPEGEALVGSLHLQGASFTVSNAGAGTPAGTARITSTRGGSCSRRWACWQASPGSRLCRRPATSCCPRASVPCVV